jgi:hypothetical protein
MNKKKKVKDGKWPNFPMTPDRCLLIQWERPKPPVDNEGNPVCPWCGSLAEMILGVFGQPCWAHDPEARKRAREALINSGNGI